MSIKEKFNKRKEYDSLNNNFSFPELPSLYTNYYLDSWYVSPFYGKVDTLGIPVIPNLSSILYCTFTTDKKPIQALEPFKNFFFPFREQYEEKYAIGSFTKSSKFFKKTIPPVKGFINNNTEYEEKIKNIYSLFVQYLISNNLFNKIKNYDEFSNELLVYIKSSGTYFTRAGYVESYDYSSLHTGLSVDIYDSTSSKDEDRINFFNDVNQDAYLELCIRNNLKIDREIPWRLHMDIRTKPRDYGFSLPFKQLNFQTEIKNYIPEYNDNLQLFFDTYYTRVIPYDDSSYPYFTEFATIIKSFYFSFISSYPTYYEYNVQECGKANVVKKSRGSFPIFETRKFLELYLKIRNVELFKVVKKETLEANFIFSLQIFDQIRNYESEKDSVLKAIKYYTDNIGTLAYRNPSLYELDEKEKMP